MSRLAIRSIQIVVMGLLFATLAIGAHADTLRVALPASEVSTTFSLVISNTANGPTDLTLQSFDADGTAQDPIELDRLDGFASRSLASSDAALFPVPPATLTIQASTPLTGFLIAVGSEGGAVGFGTEQPVGATLFIPFVAPIESFENQLVVSNTTAQSATVTLTAFDALGAELSVTEALTLPGNGVLQLDLGEENLFPGEIETISALRLTATQQVAAYLLVSTADGFLIGQIPAQKPAAPFIERLDISRDGGDLLVEIVGENFSPTLAENIVTVGETQVAVESANPLVLRVRVAGGLNGEVRVTVLGEPSNLTALNTKPVISSIDPRIFNEDEELTINGSNFSATAALNIVTFISNRGTVLEATPTQLTVRVPHGTTNGSFTVSVDGLTSDALTYIMNPVVTSLAPAAGPPGTTLKINGKNLDPVAARNTVLFNGVAATVTGASATQLSVTAPTTNAEVITGNVTIISGGLTTNILTFTGTPVITSIVPNIATAGESVTIVGANFSLVKELMTVLFNGRAATILENSQTRLVVLTPTVPGHTLAGDVTVSVSGLTSTPKPFFGKPLITNIALSVDSAGVPTTLTVTGINFNPSVTNNTALLDGVSGTITAASSTSITIALPSNVTLAMLTLTTSGIIFRREIGPIIAALSPTSGAAGSLIEIRGANFSTSTNTVSFGSDSSTVNAITSRRISISIPGSAPKGALPITVITGNSTSNTVNFTVQ